MRIAIDASSAAMPRKTGIARYIHRLIDHLGQIDRENRYLVYYRLSRLRWLRHFYRPRWKNMRVRIFQEHLSSGRGLDMFHGPDARLPGFSGPRMVATVHDVFSLVSDAFAGERFRRSVIARYRDIAGRADRIVCVSECTRRDFLRFFPEAESRTVVIPEGVDSRFSPSPAVEVSRVRQKYGIGPNYALYVGDLSRRKNVVRLIGAFRRSWRAAGGALQFVLAGRLCEGDEEVVECVQAHRGDDRFRFLGYVADEDLPALYSGAKVFFFATLYEGFGLPILEALACGTPVLTSNVSSSAEIAEEATWKVNPHSEEEMAEALVDLLSRPDPDAAKASRREAARRYDWRLTAERMLKEVYLPLLTDRRPSRVRLGGRPNAPQRKAEAIERFCG